MPFFDDSGPRIEEERTPLERSFALVRDQLERMIALNLLWSIHGLPLLLAWAFSLPEVLRIILTFYSALAIPPATAVMFAVLQRVSAGEPISRDLVVDCWRSQFKAGLLKLMPLYSLFFWLAALATLSAEQGWQAPDVLARLGLLLLFMTSLYWGPVIVSHPEWSLWRTGIQSANLVWLRPGQTLLLGLVCLAALLLGVISIAGMVLIIPTLIMLFQTEFYHALETSGR